MAHTHVKFLSEIVECWRYKVKYRVITKSIEVADMLNCSRIDFDLQKWLAVDNNIDNKLHFEIQGTIFFRVFKHVVRHIVRENLVYVSSFGSVVHSIFACIKFSLHP